MIATKMVEIRSDRPMPSACLCRIDDGLHRRRFGHDPHRAPIKRICRMGLADRSLIGFRVSMYRDYPLSMKVRRRVTQSERTINLDRNENQSRQCSDSEHLDKRDRR